MTENKEETVTCLTRQSNPPPAISWLLGDLPLQSTNQTNTSEEGSNKWKSEANLVHIFYKSDLGKRLQCVVKHIAYTDGENTTHSKMDVLCEYAVTLDTVGNHDIADKPSVRIARVSSPVLEDGSGSISLTCISESNPPARVMWSKDGEDPSPQYKDTLQFNPVTRQQAGTYVCQAENSVGRSEEEKSQVDILCKLKVIDGKNNPRQLFRCSDYSQRGSRV